MIVLPLIAVYLATAPADPGALAPARLTRALATGDILTEAYIAGGVNEETRPLIGQEARRAIPLGAPLRAVDFRAPILVERNKSVRMEYRAGALVMTTEGRALAAGAEGDLVKVMNVRSKVIVPAVVTGPGLVEVK